MSRDKYRAELKSTAIEKYSDRVGVEGDEKKP